MATQTTMLVDLGEQRRVVEERIASGEYAMADEVVQAALREFDRGPELDEAWLVQLTEESLADPRPSVPAEQVFRELREKYGQGLAD